MNVDAALQSQIRNIEATYGKSLDHWSAARFNPLFTHRVRITAATDLDDELRGWLATAYALAG